MIIQRIEYGTPAFDELYALCQEELLSPFAMEWSEEALSQAYQWQHYAVYDSNFYLLAAATLIPEKKEPIAPDSEGEMPTIPSPEKAEILQLVVKKAPRGKGIGTGLVELLERKAVQEGIKELSVQAYHEVIPFFEKHNFNKKGKATKRQQLMVKVL